MHELMSQYGLDDKVRWVGKHLDKPVVGDLYRYVADKYCVFVQPAVFEAMASGLPTFATCYGGPLEIIKDGISGFHIKQDYAEETTTKLI